MLIIGVRAVHAHPEGVSRPCRRRTDVGVRVVSVHAPRRDDPLGVPVLAGTPHVVDDLIAPVLLDGGADAAGDVVESLVPRHLFPLALATLSNALERLQDAVGVVHLVEGGWPLRAVPPAAAGMQRVPFDLVDVMALFVDVGKQSARGLAVEAHSWHEGVVALLAVRQVVGAVVHPVVPFIGMREARQAPARGRVQVFEGYVVRYRHGPLALRDGLPRLDVCVLVQRETDQSHHRRCRPPEAQRVERQRKRRGHLHPLGNSGQPYVRQGV